MNHKTSERFWQTYNQLPLETQTTADRCFELLKEDRQHPSLQFKKVGRFWSARVGIDYRALAVQRGDDLVWFWIGPHAEYDRLIKA